MNLERPRRASLGLTAAAVVWIAACGDADPGPTIPGPPPNRGPQAVGAIPPVTVSVGESAGVDASRYFSDPDGDALSYTTVSSNAGVVAATVMGSSVSVSALARGVATITVSARDPGGLIAQQNFRVTVPNRGPEAADEIPAQTVFAGQTATVDASAWFSDPDGDALRYSAASSRTQVAAVAVSGAEISIRALAPGAAVVTVGASDADGASTERVFHVTVPNRAPEPAGTIAALTLPAGATVAVDASSWFADPDGETLTYTASSSNAGVAGVSVSGDSVAVTAVARGLATVTVTARDPGGEAAQQRFRVTVPNRAPEPAGTIPPLTLPVGETGAVDVAAYFADADGDTLSYSAASSNAGVAGVSVSGDSVAVTAVARGLATVTVTARDPGGETAQQTFPVTVPNRAPEPAGTIPPLALPAGETAAVDVSAYFADADDDTLSYSAASSNAGVAAVSASGGVVTVRAVAPGDATVTITASDPGGLSASSAFGVSVADVPSGFRIELVFATVLTAAQEAVFRRAAERWMTILAPTDFPDATLNRTVRCGRDPRFERYVETIDDLMIAVAVEEMDGPGGTLARAGLCWWRHGSLQPIYGRMEFDATDFERLDRAGNLEDVVLHEMGHVLGIGILWHPLGLLRNPASANAAPDTHFTGRLAIEAFDEAGGANYAGAKVPVENTGGPGTWNGHWRESVLETELMTGYLNGGPEPLSAITVQSLADLGYSVDLATVDLYRLPGADAAPLIKEQERIPYGDDIWRGPVVSWSIDTRRIVRIIGGF